MHSRWVRRRPLVSSVVGCITATALDLAVLAGASAAGPAFQPAGLLFIAAVSGIVVAPMGGWWAGRRAGSEELRWMRTALLALAGLSFGW